jgi:hypothetical protein
MSVGERAVPLPVVEILCMGKVRWRLHRSFLIFGLLFCTPGSVPPHHMGAGLMIISLGLRLPDSLGLRTTEGAGHSAEG